MSPGSDAHNARWGCGPRAARWLRPARLEPAGDGAVANSTLLADLAIGLAATPLRDHLNLDGRRQGMGQDFGRRAIDQSGFPLSRKRCNHL